MDEIDFRQQMLRLTSLKAKLDDEVIGAYWEALQHVSLPSIKAAITKILQEERRFPTVSRIQKVFLNLTPEDNSRVTSKGALLQSFHCGTCDVDFSVILSRDPRATVRCVGDGVSSCGRVWTIGELNAALVDSRERQQDTPIL